MHKVTISRMRGRYAQTVLTLRITYVRLGQSHSVLPTLFNHVTASVIWGFFFCVSTVVSGFCFLSISEFHVGLVLHCVSRFSEDDTSVPKHVAVGTYRELWFVSYILLHFINFICWLINLLAPELFFNFITPCIQNVNNTGTKYVRIMKQTAFWRWKNLEYIPCLKYSVPIFVE